MMQPSMCADFKERQESRHTAVILMIFFFRSNCAKNTVDKPYWHFIRGRTNEYPTLLSFHLPFQEHFVGNNTTNLCGYCKKGKEPEGLTVDGLLSLSNGAETGDS